LLSKAVTDGDTTINKIIEDKTAQVLNALLLTDTFIFAFRIQTNAINFLSIVVVVSQYDENLRRGELILFSQYVFDRHPGFAVVTDNMPDGDTRAFVDGISATHAINFYDTWVGREMS
jgi:hypothetical protein